MRETINYLKKKEFYALFVINVYGAGAVWCSHVRDSIQGPETEPNTYRSLAFDKF